MRVYLRDVSVQTEVADQTFHLTQSNQKKIKYINGESDSFQGLDGLA